MTILSRSKTDSDEAVDAGEGEYDDEEEEIATWSRKPVSLLSLNSKPDRNLALLDEYELEECDSSHKSGLSPLSSCARIFSFPNSELELNLAYFFEDILVL